MRRVSDNRNSFIPAGAAVGALTLASIRFTYGRLSAQLGSVGVYRAGSVARYGVAVYSVARVANHHVWQRFHSGEGSVKLRELVHASRQPVAAVGSRFHNFEDLSC